MSASSFYSIFLGLVVTASGVESNFGDRSGEIFTADKKPVSAEKGGEKLSVRKEKEKEKKDDKDKEKKPKTITEATKGDKKIEGLFTLFQNTTNGAVQILIKEKQLDKEYIYFTFTQDGVVQAGHFRGNFRDNRIFSLRKHFNRIEFVAENTSFYFD